MPRARIVVAGGTGLLGRALSDALAQGGRDVIVLTRQPSSATIDPSRAATLPAGVHLAHWTPDGTAGPWAALLDGASAVVNLAGESIGAGRWSSSRKRRLCQSRFDATSSLVAGLAACAEPPALFLSGSAVGYYGLRGDERLTETSPAGSDFLAQLCAEWEAIAGRAAANVRRVVIVRAGLVLDRTGGALPRMIVPFRFYAGGPLGAGCQYISWIHIDDWVALVTWAVDHPALSGPLNATAPDPVTNREFARAVGAALGRPAWLPAPAFALRALLGEMADALLLGGQRVIPDRALGLGFTFRYAELKTALASVLRQR